MSNIITSNSLSHQLIFGSPSKKDVRGLQVLSSSNNAKRKILIELGFVTTPKDAKRLFSNIDKIAQQLKDGLLINIQKVF